MPEIITELDSIEEFGKILENSPGMVLIKFGATWCKPCKKVEHQVTTYMKQLPSNFKCFIIDIDECFEIYAFFKSKRMVSGIPAILAWKKGNVSNIPDHMIASSDPKEVDLFFQKCVEISNS